MLPWEILDTASAPDGGVLTLCRRGGEYAIRINNLELMGTRSHDSEESLSTRGCAHLAGKRGARVLIGGLGVGYSLRAALDVLGPDARVDVAELVPAVVRWNRGVLGAFARAPLDDPRAHVIESDVSAVIRKAQGQYDAILLDVDNGPDALTVDTNDALYSRSGIEHTARALRPGGVFAVWSVADDPRFTARLRAAGFNARTERVAARVGGGRRHLLWLAVRGDRPAKRR